jgi:hypothetical protein
MALTAELQKKASDILSLSNDELMKNSLVALLNERLRTINIERLSLCKRYNVTSLYELA